MPCAQPSPRGDAPSPLAPLAFAKSCKGGDVSVLDPALAWDVRFIYLFIYRLKVEVARAAGKAKAMAARDGIGFCPAYNQTALPCKTAARCRYALSPGCQAVRCCQVICRSVGQLSGTVRCLCQTSCQVLSVLSGAVGCVSDRRGAL